MALDFCTVGQVKQNTSKCDLGLWEITHFIEKMINQDNYVKINEKNLI